MKKNFKLLALAMMATAAVFTACEPTENNGGSEDKTQGVGALDVYDLDTYEIDRTGATYVNDGETLPSEISGVVIVKQDASVKLDGGLHVKKGGFFVIEKGATITAQYDESNTDYIFVEQGGIIDAQGTASDVIVMTSTKEEVGAWGGIHICGEAPINTAIPSSSEIESLPYGGNNPGDNSGTLRYVRVEFSGYSYSEDQECNGVSCYGVGAGTTIEYVQAYHGSDDGFEFFGGTVNIKHCVVTSCSDDSFDWTDGWVGKAQFIIAYQESDIDFKCDCLLECDNQGDNNTATPASHPVIANATLVGNNFGGQKTDGVMLKAGTEIELYNSIITGKEDCIVVKTANTDAQLADGKSKLAGISMSSELSNISDEQTYLNADFVKAGNSTSFAASSLTNDYFGTVAAAALPVSHSFFTATSYAGAISASNDWTAGWVRK